MHRRCLAGQMFQIFPAICHFSHFGGVLAGMVMTLDKFYLSCRISNVLFLDKGDFCVCLKKGITSAVLRGLN